MKTKGFKETDFLTLLQRVLSSALPDVHLASRVYDDVAKEIRLINSVRSLRSSAKKKVSRTWNRRPSRSCRNNS